MMHVRWRGLELPASVILDEQSATDTFGRFTIEPFERGFGTTIGNSLRRILLSTIEGSAITSIRVGGAEHEFCTIQGVNQDMVDIVLNVKSLVVKNHSGSTRVITVEKDQAGPILASDIQTDADVEIINPNLVLANLTDDVPFMM